MRKQLSELKRLVKVFGILALLLLLPSRFWPDKRMAGDEVYRGIRGGFWALIDDQWVYYRERWVDGVDRHPDAIWKCCVVVGEKTDDFLDVKEGFWKAVGYVMFPLFVAFALGVMTGRLL